jgi:hypothetical protein
MLTNPRRYTWVPHANPNHSGQPFVEAETMRAALAGPRRFLVAGDGHRLPFPRRILSSQHYQQNPECRVIIYNVERRPPNADYVMEIHLAGQSHTLERAARVLTQSVGLTGQHGPRMGRPGLVGPVVAGIQAAASILTDPSPLAGESHWDQNVELSTGRVVVHYDYLP